MMLRFFSTLMALSWALISLLQGVDLAGDGAQVAIIGAAQTQRTLSEKLGLGDFDSPVSLCAFTPDLLAAEPPPWSEAPSPVTAESSAPGKQAPASMSIAMWFGVLGATLLILPRFRRR